MYSLRSSLRKVIILGYFVTYIRNIQFGLTTMAESRQKMVIAAESECKYNKWQRSFEVNAASLMQMVTFPLPITAFSIMKCVVNTTAP